MTKQVIQDWTDSRTDPSWESGRPVRYKVFKEGDSIFQEIADDTGTPIHTLELPEGLALEKSSYEVMLQYVLADVVNF